MITSISHDDYIKRRLDFVHIRGSVVNYDAVDGFIKIVMMMMI